MNISSVYSYKDAILNKIPKPSIILNSGHQKNETKKRAREIFVIKDTIPSKEDILRLCSHGLYGKINLINLTFFNDENTTFYINHMNHKLNEIKVWKEEAKNNNEQSKKRFKQRTYDIHKTIDLFKKKHLEHISNSIC